MDERPSFGDTLGLVSLLLGYQNLLENREQSRHNDVSAANDAQAQYLLQELGRQFNEQNEMLKTLIEQNDKLLKLLGGSDNA